MDDLSNKVKAAAGKMNEKPAPQTDNQKSAEKKDQDNGENEITIQ